MGLDAEHALAGVEHGDRAVVGRRQRGGAGGSRTTWSWCMYCSRGRAACGSIHGSTCSTTVSWGPMPHPVSARLDLAAEGVGQHLVPEADPDEGHARVGDVHDEAGQLVDPRLVVVGGVPRPRAHVGVEVVRGAGQLAAAGVDRHELEPVGFEQPTEHVAVVAGDAHEPLVDVIALQQRDPHHSGVT